MPPEGASPSPGQTPVFFSFSGGFSGGGAFFGGACCC